MPQVIFAQAAIRDLERHRAFLRTKNPDAAKRAATAIIQGVEVLGKYPRMGRLIEDLPEQYREWLIDFGNSGYIARYHIRDDAITVLTIRHQKEAE